MSADIWRRATARTEKLVDELLRVGQEVVVVVLVPRNYNPGLENFYPYFKDSNETTVYKTCAASWSENEFQNHLLNIIWRIAF